MMFEAAEPLRRGFKSTTSASGRYRAQSPPPVRALIDRKRVLRKRYGLRRQLGLERIPLTFEHSPRGERSFCILVG
jgi:hypothetical protein